MMSRFPTEPPKASADAWWLTTSLTELKSSATVIEQFTRETKEPPLVSREAFARAMALQMLCVDEGVLDAVMDHADAISERLRSQLQPDRDMRERKAFGPWLDRLEEIGRGLLRCAELLPDDLRDKNGPALMDFLRGIEEHIEAHLQFFIAGRVVPLVPTARRSSRKP